MLELLRFKYDLRNLCAGNLIPNVLEYNDGPFGMCLSHEGLTFINRLILILKLFRRVGSLSLISPHPFSIGISGGIYQI